MTGARRPLLPAIVLALASIAGCQQGSPAAGPDGAGAAPSSAATPAAGATPSAGAAGATGDVATVWGEFVACARSHDQNWPDPVFDDDQGPPTFPEVDGFDVKTGYEAVRADCGPILDRLPASANPFAAQPVTAEQLEVMRRYSRCMREHPGMESFPDPDADGSLHIPEELQRPPLLDQQNAARNVCDPLLQELLR